MQQPGFFELVNKFKERAVYSLADLMLLVRRVTTPDLSDTDTANTPKWNSSNGNTGE
jgi:hypothetical protein